MRTRRAIRSVAIATIVGVGAWLSAGCSARTPLPAFVVVVVDMLRADHVSSYGYAKDTTPNLRRLAQSGVVFERAYAPAPWTYPSVVSLLTALPPVSHGATRDLATGTLVNVGDPDLWVPPQFAAAGYRTAAFHTHPYLRESASNVAQAFEEYHDPALEAVERTGNRHVEEMFLDVLYPPVERWLRAAAGSPFLLYVHAIDVHGPYAEPHVMNVDRERLGAALPDILAAALRMDETGFFTPTDIENPNKDLLYDGHIESTDRYLGFLGELLTELGIADNTYLVVTSDHGEGFGENGDWGHGRSLDEYAIRVPLVIGAHGALPAGTRVERAVSLTGLLPTLARLGGVEVGDEIGRASGFAGLLMSGEANVAAASSSASSPIWSETDRGPGFDAILLQDGWKLTTNRTTGEQTVTFVGTGLAPSTAGRLAALQMARSGFLEHLTTYATERRGLDEESLRALRALGYIR